MCGHTLALPNMSILYGKFDLEYDNYGKHYFYFYKVEYRLDTYILSYHTVTGPYGSAIYINDARGQFKVYNKINCES